MSVFHPGLNPETKMDVYKPSRLELEECDKYVEIDSKRLTVGDGDEYEEIKKGEEEDEYSTVKTPESYLGRWVSIKTDKEEEISINTSPKSVLSLEGGDQPDKENVEGEIKHPLQGSLLEEVKWHPSLEMTDYVYSVTRDYSGRHDNVELKFVDEDKRVSFGYQRKSEGVSLKLNSNLVDIIREDIKSGILNGEPRWCPTGLKATKTFITEKTGVSYWMVESIVGIIIASEYPELTSDLPSSFFQKLENLWEEGRFESIAYRYYEAKSNNAHIEEDIDEVEMDEEFIQSKVDDAVRVVEKILAEESNLTEEYKNYLDTWIEQTVVSSFGMAAINALERLSGLDEQDIGYTIDLKGLDKDIYRVYLYDKTSYGNGSCKLLKRHFQILAVQRHNSTEESRALPSNDFINLLQQELFQCSQFHTDINALSMIDSEGISELGYVTPESREVHRVSGDTWRSLDISSRDAWKLPILNNSVEYIAEIEDGLESDDLIRATDICWDGCPECLENYAAMLGSKTAHNLLDKTILDHLVHKAWMQLNEFRILKTEDLLSGEPTGLGKPTKLKLKIDTPSGEITKRAYSLPYTLGLWMSRDDLLGDIDLVIQTSDVLGLNLQEDNTKSAHGVSSMEFKRLMGYNLIMTCFLEKLGVIPEERKKINLLFYDCRDIDIEDMSVSPRIKEAIRFKNEDNLRLEKISDILKWLSHRGYEIKICVDKDRSREEGVRDFLDKMDIPGVYVSTKNLVGWSSMHGKALQTPLAVLQGSANLTHSGTNSNDEMVNYFPYTTDGYMETELSIETHFEDSEEYIKRTG